MPKALGEREIIKILTSIYGSNTRFPLGFNDDVAAIPVHAGRWILLKTDMLVGSTDIPPGMNLWQAARKAVVATVSDFAAKGVRPKALMISLGLPFSLGRRGVNQIGQGLRAGVREYRVSIAGGDTNQSDDLVIDCVGVGETVSGRIMTRAGARPGDVVAVTGQFGNAAAGLRMLLSRKDMKSTSSAILRRAALLPSARLREGLLLAKTGAVSSSIDSSDGLAWSLHELCRASKVEIELDTIPVTREARDFGERNSVSSEALALYGGEEYELVVTVEKEKFQRVRTRLPEIIPIGRVRRGTPRVTANLGQRNIDVEARGWEHFAGRD